MASSAAATLVTIPTQTGPSTVARTGVIKVIKTHSVDSLLPHIITPSMPSIATKLISSTQSASTNTPSTGFKAGAVPRNILKPTVAANAQQSSSSNTNNQQSRTAAVDPIPAVIPEFQTGKIDAKRFPARHFDFESLVIGSWKVISYLVHNKGGSLMDYYVHVSKRILSCPSHSDNNRNS